MERLSWPKQIFDNKCYCDINIPVGPKCRQVCEAAISLGYKLLAVNTPVLATSCLQQSNSGGKKGKKRKLEERTGGTLSAAAVQVGHSSQNGVPAPKIQDWIQELTEKHKDVSILQRLTVIFYDVNHLQTVLAQENVPLYDILAVVPTNHDALVSCIISTTITFDVVSFDIEGPHWINKVKLNRQKGKVASDKDVFFEITYAPSFHGDEPCGNMMYLGNRLTEDICTRRIKNIIISSGASSPEELRSPRDVLGIGHLLGLDESTTRTCIRNHGGRVARKAGSRRYGKSWVAFIPAAEDK